MTDSERYEAAKRRVEAKYAFYMHAVVFVAVNLLLVVINLMTSPGAIWFVWPLFGWGIGLAAHGVTVYFGPRSGALKEQMIRKEMAKMDREEGS